MKMPSETQALRFDASALPDPLPDSAATAAAPVASRVSVRDCRPEDLPRIHAIYKPHVLEGFSTFEEVPPDIPTLAARRDDVLLRGMPYLVAELDGEVKGYAYAGPFRMRSAYRYTVEDSIYVESGLVGRGIGRALLAELVARCTVKGMRQMIAVIGSRGGEENASIRLHTRLGFREAARLTSIGFKHGRWIDGTIMQLALGPADSEPPVW